VKTLLVWLLLALSLPAFGQAPPPVAASEEATAAITKLRDGLITSFKKSDINGLLEHLDSEVVVTWQNGEVCQGRDAVRGFYQRMMTGDQRVVREIKSEPEVQGRHNHGDWAVSWGNLHDHFVLNDGSDLPLNSVFTATIARKGDRWLVTAFHASVNTFDNPVLQLATHKTGLWLGLAGVAIGLLLGAVGSRLLARKSSL
jgi:ketosteroid isomerase-like protein